jgi:hypothetical protein
MKIELLGADEVSKALKKLGSDLPGTLAAGVNRTMRAIEQAQLNAMETSLDRPSIFTMNALGVQPANARHLDASIFVRPLQADYLKATIEGAVLERTIVPFRIKRDRFGNIPGKRRGWKGMARGKSVFVSKIQEGRAAGKVGLWRKQGQSAFLLALADKNARREKRWPYFETAERVAAKRLQSDVLGAIDDAMRRL